MTLMGDKPINLTRRLRIRTYSLETSLLHRAKHHPMFINRWTQVTRQCSVTVPTLIQYCFTDTMSKQACFHPVSTLFPPCFHPVFLPCCLPIVVFSNSLVITSLRRLATRTYTSYFKIAALSPRRRRCLRPKCRYIPHFICGFVPCRPSKTEQ